MILTDAAVCINFFPLMHPSFWIQDTVPDGTNGDGSETQPGVEKSGQPDETDPKRQLVREGGGSKNDTDGNNRKDNSTEGTGGRKDEPLQEPRDKDSKATESSPTTDFMQDPLILECDPSHRCVIEKNKFIACLKVPGEGKISSSLRIRFLLLLHTYLCQPFWDLVNFLLCWSLFTTSIFIGHSNSAISEVVNFYLRNYRLKYLRMEKLFCIEGRFSQIYRLRFGQFVAL
jgi:hypothetical protein